MLVADIRGIAWNRRPESGAPARIWSRLVADAAAAAVWLREARCGLGGHTMVLHFEPKHMALQCVGCGKRTPGWDV